MPGGQSKWKRLGEGSFHIAFLNENPEKEKLIAGSDYSGPIVFKKRKDHKGEDEARVRQMRIAREMNLPVSEEQADLENNGEQHSGWVLPYFATAVSVKDDDAMAREVLNIYQKTGRIVVDGFISGNFRKNADGSIVCVDFDFAKRRGSIVSEESWQSYRTTDFCKKCSDALTIVPNTAKMILILLWREEHFKEEQVEVASLHYESLMKQYEEVINGLESINDIHIIYAASILQIFTQATNLDFVTPKNLELLAEDPMTVKEIITAAKNKQITTDKIYKILNAKEERLAREIEEKRQKLIADIRKVTHKLEPDLLDSKPLFCKALTAAVNYLNANKFGFFSPHGANGREQTQKFIRTLTSIDAVDLTDARIRQEMKTWLKGGSWQEFKTNISSTSRSRYACESGVLGNYADNLFETAPDKQKQEALKDMCNYSF